MVTIYELLEVEENASKEEIEKAYQKLFLEYKINPILSEKENKENEMILNKLKIAYGILMDDEKRKKYDKDLAQKRAEDLIKKVEVTSKKEEKIEDDSFYDNDMNYSEEAKLTDDMSNDSKIVTNSINSDEKLTRKEKNQIRKFAKKEFKENLKKAEQIEAEYNTAYNKAYNEYLKKIGYKTQKVPMTLKRLTTTVLIIIVTIIVCFILWKIPPINKILVGIYSENPIIKALVDIIANIIEAILDMFN